MKQSLLIACCVFLFAAVSCSQKLKEKDLPAPVKTAFAKAYTSPGKVSWGKEDENSYEASFTYNGKETSVVYSKDGELLETESEITVDELPGAVKDYIMTNYKNAKIAEATKIIKKDGAIVYEAEVNKKDLLFDASGVLLPSDK
jgi:hypothetical protein